MPASLRVSVSSDSKTCQDRDKELAEQITPGPLSTSGFVALRSQVALFLAGGDLEEQNEKERQRAKEPFFSFYSHSVFMRFTPDRTVTQLSQSSVTRPRNQDLFRAFHLCPCQGTGAMTIDAPPFIPGAYSGGWPAEPMGRACREGSATGHDMKTLHTIRSPFPAPKTKAKACGTQSEVDGRAAQCAPRLHNLEGQNCVAWTGRGNHDPGIAKCSMSWQTPFRASFGVWWISLFGREL